MSFFLISKLRPQMFIKEKINGAGAEPSELEAIFNPCLMPTVHINLTEEAALAETHLLPHTSLSNPMH